MKRVVIKLRNGEEVLGRYDEENSKEDRIVLKDAMVVKSFISQDQQPLVRLVKYSVFSKGYTVGFAKGTITHIFDLNKEMIPYYENAVHNSKAVLEKEAKLNIQEEENELSENDMSYILNNWTSNTIN